MTTAVSRITPCPSGYTDHIYKVAEGGVAIPLRIWAAPRAGTEPEGQAEGASSAGAGSKTARPWVFWIHGGGFVGGKHVVPNAWVIPAFRLLGYHVVSPAYRFMPHVQLPHILSDIQDAFAWSRAHLPLLLGADRVDVDAYVAAGDSAGGTMSTLCGIYLDPRPRVVLDVFGVVDMTDPHFYTLPSDEVRDRVLGYMKPRDGGGEDALVAALAERDPAQAEVICPWRWELEPEMSLRDLRVFWGYPEFETTDAHVDRMDLNTYMNRTASRMTTLLQREKFASEDEFRAEVKTRWSVQHMADATYPPTFILHGTGDNAVPVQQSYAFEARLKELAVPTGARYDPGGEHCFENKIERPEDAGWDEYIVSLMAFVEEHIYRK